MNILTDVWRALIYNLVIFANLAPGIPTDPSILAVAVMGRLDATGCRWRQRSVNWHRVPCRRFRWHICHF
jgi:hypothetical protein